MPPASLESPLGKAMCSCGKKKPGIAEPEDISDKEAVCFGKESEAAIRRLFELDFPQFHVDYDEFGMKANEPDCPFIFATLDGELTDQNGRKGILEIKTTEIRRSVGLEKSGTDRYQITTMHRLSTRCSPQDMSLQS